MTNLRNRSVKERIRRKTGRRKPGRLYRIVYGNGIGRSYGIGRGVGIGRHAERDGVGGEMKKKWKKFVISGLFSVRKSRRKGGG